MNIEVSNGDILDKLSILEIKIIFIKDKLKINNISKELFYLKTISQPLFNNINIKDLYIELKNINEQLWHIENNIREKEKKQIFDKSFIDLARKVYFTNDIRAKIKKQINILSESNFIEEKSYSNYIVQ